MTAGITLDLDLLMVRVVRKRLMKRYGPYQRCYQQ